MVKSNPMHQYHFSPKLGRLSKCSNPANCPFGAGPSAHVLTRDLEQVVEIIAMEGWVPARGADKQADFEEATKLAVSLRPEQVRKVLFADSVGLTLFSPPKPVREQQQVGTYKKVQLDSDDPEMVRFFS